MITQTWVSMSFWSIKRIFSVILNSNMTQGYFSNFCLTSIISTYFLQKKNYLNTLCPLMQIKPLILELTKFSNNAETSSKNYWFLMSIWIINKNMLIVKKSFWTAYSKVLKSLISIREEYLSKKFTGSSKKFTQVLKLRYVCRIKKKRKIYPLNREWS